MSYFWAAVIIFAILAWYGNRELKKQQKQIAHTKIKMLNREGQPFTDEMQTYIAGLKHHITKADIGGFTGLVVPEPTNKHDRNAMGVYNSSGKLLGYIPASELRDYRKWCEAQPQPCAGFIYAEDGELRGRVKIVRPCNAEFIKDRFTSYFQWIKDNVGDAYLPKNLSMKFDVED